MIISTAELHVHIEGSITPFLARRIAEKNRIFLPENMFNNGQYHWSGFDEFLKVYDLASYTLRTVEDYRDCVYEYLRNSFKEGMLYCEMLVSPDHAAMCGLSYQELIEGMVQGIDDARNDFSIESRILIMCVRNFGVDSCIRIATQAAKYSHPYVVGFTMGGDEINYPPHEYIKAYQIANEAGLGCSIHAGEMAGADSVKEAILSLPIKRIGHGVRAIEDLSVVDLLIEKNITLEVCLSSNVALEVFSDYAQHPFAKLRNLGVSVTLNTDDPPYFSTSIAHEYLIAKKYFSLSSDDLQGITHQAITASFADADTKQKLLGRLKTSVSNE